MEPTRAWTRFDHGTVTYGLIHVLQNLAHGIMAKVGLVGDCNMETKECYYCMC